MLLLDCCKGPGHLSISSRIFPHSTCPGLLTCLTNERHGYHSVRVYYDIYITTNCPHKTRKQVYCLYMDETRAQTDEVNCPGVPLSPVAAAEWELSLLEPHRLRTNHHPLPSVRPPHFPAQPVLQSQRRCSQTSMRPRHSISEEPTSKPLPLKSLPCPLSHKALLLTGSHLY